VSKNRSFTGSDIEDIKEQRDPKDFTMDMASKQAFQRKENALQETQQAPVPTQAVKEQSDPNLPLYEAGANTVAGVMKSAAKNEATDMSGQKQSAIDTLVARANNATTQAEYDSAVSELEAMNQSTEQQSSGMQAVGAVGSAISGATSAYNIAQGSEKPEDYMSVGKSGIDAANYIGNAYNASVAAETGLKATNAVAGTGSALGAVGDALGYVGAAYGIGKGLYEMGTADTPSEGRYGLNEAIGGVMSAVTPFYAIGSGAAGLVNAVTKPNEDWQTAMGAFNPSGAMQGRYQGSLQEKGLKQIDRFFGEDLGNYFGTVICTQLYIQNRISREVYKADGRFGREMDYIEYQWYLSWGRKLAQRMAFSQLISSIVAFFFVPISKYMAGETGVGNGSFRGKVYFKTLQLACRFRRK
jgi:hypothetical protein